MRTRKISKLGLAASAVAGVVTAALCGKAVGAELAPATQPVHMLQAGLDFTPLIVSIVVTILNFLLGHTTAKPKDEE